MGNDIKIWIEGRPADLYGLSLLFASGVSGDYTVVTKVTGEPTNVLHRVTDSKNRRTYVTGEMTDQVLIAMDDPTAEMVCYQLLKPLNAYAVLIDSSFVPVRAVSVDIKTASGYRHFIFGNSGRASKITTLGRHSTLQERMPERIKFLKTSHIARESLEILGQRPSWSRYYRLLENVAKDCNTTISKINKTGFMTARQKTEFTKAANNSMQAYEDPRHGYAKIDPTLR